MKKQKCKKAIWLVSVDPLPSFQRDRGAGESEALGFDEVDRRLGGLGFTRHSGEIDEAMRKQ